MNTTEGELRRVMQTHLTGDTPKRDSFQVWNMDSNCEPDPAEHLGAQAVRCSQLQLPLIFSSLPEPQAWDLSLMQVSLRSLSSALFRARGWHTGTNKTIPVVTQFHKEGMWHRVPEAMRVLSFKAGSHIVSMVWATNYFIPSLHLSVNQSRVSSSGGVINFKTFDKQHLHFQVSSSSLPPLGSVSP